MRSISAFVYSLVALVAIGAAAPGFAQEREAGGVGLTVYTEGDFRGSTTTFREDEPNLERIGLNDAISSLRAGPGERWEVCEDAFYRGRCVVVAGEERDLRRVSWNDTISSLRRVDGQSVPPRDGTAPSSAAPYRPGAGSRRGWNVVLFDQTNYRGRSANLTGPAPKISRRVRSVTVGRGVWEVCDRPNYKGRCKTLDDSVPDVRVLHLRGRVASVRPVPRTRPVPPAPGETSLTLFKQPDYRGAATTFKGAVGALSEDDSRAQSADIEGGDWQLCEGRNFTGRCVTLERSASDLEAHGLRDRVGSVRPVRNDPRGPDAGTLGLFDRRWILSEMEGRRFNAEALNMEFDRNQNRVSGSSGCNRFVGTFQMDGSRLAFSPLAGTRRACADNDMQRAENAFLRLLASTTRYEVRGNTLHLYSNEVPILSFESR